jgi:hypothetical protein
MIKRGPATGLLECAVYISARKKLIHAMSLDTDPTDYSRNSCRICYFCHLQLFEITHAKNIKSAALQPAAAGARAEGPLAG